MALSTNKLSSLLLSSLLIPVFAQSASALTGPSNYWECILDRMPKATTDQEAGALHRQCRWDFPDFYYRRALPKDEGFWPFTTKAGDCMKARLPKTPSVRARDEIREACLAKFPR